MPFSYATVHPETARLLRDAVAASEAAEVAQAAINGVPADIKMEDARVQNLLDIATAAKQGHRAKRRAKQLAADRAMEAARAAQGGTDDGGNTSSDIDTSMATLSIGPDEPTRERGDHAPEEIPPGRSTCCRRW